MLIKSLTANFPMPDAGISADDNDKIHNNVADDVIGTFESFDGPILPMKNPTAVGAPYWQYLQ